MRPNPFMISDDGDTLVLYLTQYSCWKKHVKIPDGIKEINTSAFYYNDDLTTVEIPNTVTHIGQSAFQCCRKLQSIKMPNNLTQIGAQAFQACESLKNIIIPNTVTMISKGAFNWCTSLKCNQFDKRQKKFLAYKGFDKDFSCEKFHYTSTPKLRYEVGKTYHDDTGNLYVNGFHAYLNPLSVLNDYLNINGNRYALVELSGKMNWERFDKESEIASTDMRIIKELTFQDLINDFNRLNN